MAENNINYKSLLAKLEKALVENERLRNENVRLKKILGLPDEPYPETLIPVIDPVIQQSMLNAELVTKDSSQESKIEIFRSLFHGRDDVYPVRWERKDGKSGYTPACANEWNREFCKKPQIKCANCPERKLLPVTDEVIHKHLIGKHTIGVYPLLPDEQCWFIAADFDKQTWKNDVSAFLSTCERLGVPAALERSRSGNGAHVWIFFAHSIPASTARMLGSYILTQTMILRPDLGFDSYDRFFPNQDTMPKGGFGNLIALPLQHAPRLQNNSVFVDRNWQPYADQWAFLSSLKRMEISHVESILREARLNGGIIGVRQVENDDEERDPWTRSETRIAGPSLLPGPFPPKLDIVYSNQVFIRKDSQSPSTLNYLLRLAAFQNPEFYKAQAMRLPTFDKPRIISCADDYPAYIGLPRGSLDEVIELFNYHKVEVQIVDKRCQGSQIDVQFVGELTPPQQEAARKLMDHDCGILSAATAFGKTIVAAAIIAARKTNTLVLVHRRQLMDQWKARLETFLNISSDDFGIIGGGKDKKTGKIDIAMLQSLNHKGVVNDLVRDYGQVIVDECHHLSAFSFEQVLKQVKAQYVLGLTATPIRKDGHHPIFIMQCGPIRFRVDARKQADIRPFDHIVIPRYTEFANSEDYNGAGIHNLYAALVGNENRNELIFDDILHALDEGRSPILLTERTNHVDYFAERLKGFTKNLVVLRGGMGKKQRQSMAEQIAAIPDDEERIIIATGRYIGEGFDDARLDTLFLVMPISWKGTLQQYAGRLHRAHHNKHDVRIYDYVDVNVPVLMRMFEKRLKGYHNMGYEIKH
ncbi:MAG: DEAD/DEAH box helicase family protein [Syntrophomonas sp.]